MNTPGALSAERVMFDDHDACDRTLQSRLSWDHLISTIALRIRRSIELSNILQTAVDKVHQLLGCDRVLIYRFAPDWSGSVAAEAVSAPQWSVLERIIHDPCFESIWLEPYQENRYVAIEDVATADLTPCHAEFLSGFHVKANLVVPILQGDNLWGLLIAHHCQAPRPWQPVEIDGLQHLSVQVGIAIHQASLIEELQAAKTNLEAQVADRTHELEQANQHLAEQVLECQHVAAEVIHKEEFLRQVLDSLFTFVGVLTLDGILVEANQAPLEASGLTRADVIDKPFGEAYWWASSPSVQASIQQAIETARQGHSVRFDIPVQVKEGQYTTIDFSLTPLRNPSGEITHLIPSGIDISDRLQAEAERTRLLDMLEASVNEIYLFNADTLSFEYANQGALHNLGYSLEQLQQITTVDIQPELTAPDFEILVAPLRRQEMSTVNFETVHQRADGSCYPVDIHLQLTQRGRESSFLAVILDITERKQAEAQRLQDQAQLQQLGTIVASSNDAIISKTPDGIVTSWNGAAEAMFGYSAAEMIGQPITTIIPSEHWEETEHILERIRHGQWVETYEALRRHKNGQLIDVSLTISPIYDENDHIIGVSKIARDISAQKCAERLRQQAENALRASQERFQRFMENAPLLSWIVSRKGQVEYANDAWLTFMGQSEAAALGQTIEAVLPPEFTQVCQAGNQRVLQTGQVVETLEQGINPDGALRVFLVRKFPIYIEGQIASVGGIAVDITEQQQAEALIRNQAETLSIFYGTSPLMMGLVEISDNDILHLSDNPAALSFFGLTAEALANHWASEVGVPAEITHLWLTHYRQSQQQQRPVQFDYTHITPADQHHLLVTVSFVGLGDSDRPRFSYIVQDLTEKKQLEREKDNAITRLHDSEQRYASLVAAVPVGIFRADPTGQCTYANEQWQAMTGISLEQALGSGWSEGIYPDDRGPVFTAWTTAAQTQQRFELEYRLQATTGKIIWVYGQAVAEYTAAGELLGYVGTVTDITERKQIEAERQRAKQTEQELSLLEQILDVVLAGYWDWNIPTNDEYLSPGFKRMFGYADHELPNCPETWQNLIFPEDLPGLLNQFDRHVQSHGVEPFYNEVRYRHKNGSTIWVLCSGQVIEWNEDGTPLRMIGCHIDISQLKQTEAALHQQLAAIEAAVDGIAILQGDTYLYLNQAHLTMFGYDHPAELVGQSWQKLYSQAELSRFEQEVFPVLAQDRVWQGEAIAIRRDGSTFYEGLSLTLTEDGLLICICRDITERRQIEATMALQLAAIEATVDGIGILKEGQYIFVNQAHLSFFGLTDTSDLLGQTWTKLYSADEVRRFEQDIFPRLQQDRRWQGEAIATRQDGSTFPQELSLTLTETNILICICRDTTQRQQTAQALQNSEMQLSGILNSSLDGIMAFQSIRDDQGRIIDFEWLLSNASASDLVGKPASDLVGKRLLEEMPGNRDEGLFALYMQVVETGEPFQRQFHYAHEGVDTWFENIAVKLGDGFAVTFRDISALKTSEQALQQANQNLEMHLHDLKQRNTEMQLLSETSDFLQACRTLGEACAVITTLVQPLFPDCAGGFFITSASRNRVEKAASWGEHLHSQSDFYPHDCWALRRGRLHQLGQDRLGLRCNHVSPTPNSLVTLCIPMIAQGETLGLFYLNSESAEALNDVKQQLARTVAEQVGLAIANLHLRETLQQQSIRDALTGLFNRRYLEEALQQEIGRAQRNQYAIAVVMVDVDHFKRFNDTHGHNAGDYVLQAIGKILRENIRESDVACRYGGEELTLVFPETTLEEAVARVEGLRQTIHQLTIHYNGTLLEGLSASFGVAAFPSHGTTGLALIQAADVALYRAKQTGRNRVVAASLKGK